MEKIKNKIERMAELSIKKEQLDELTIKLNEKEKRLKDLNQELQLTMIGSIDRKIKNEEVEKANKEFEDMKQEKIDSKEKLNEEFESRRESLLSEIDTEMSKYKEKSELEQLISQKNAYEKVAENAQKTIDNALKDLEEGKDINQALLANAREELKANKSKSEELRKRNRRIYRNRIKY